MDCILVWNDMSDPQKPEESQIVPLMEERPSISKRIVRGEVVIEKRWVTKNRTIEVPVNYEEIYVNGHLSGQKSKLVKKKSKQTPAAEELVPIFDGSTETEMVVPLFGEEIVISRKMVKVGEAVIRKRKVTENKKIGVKVASEKISTDQAAA